MDLSYAFWLLARRRLPSDPFIPCQQVKVKESPSNIIKGVMIIPSRTPTLRVISEPLWKMKPTIPPRMAGRIDGTTTSTRPSTIPMPSTRHQLPRTKEELRESALLEP